MYPSVRGFAREPPIDTTRPSCTRTSKLHASGQSSGQAEATVAVAGVSDLTVPIPRILPTAPAKSPEFEQFRSVPVHGPFTPRCLQLGLVRAVRFSPRRKEKREMNKSVARILAIGVAVALPTGLFAQSAAAPKPTAAPAPAAGSSTSSSTSSSMDSKTTASGTTTTTKKKTTKKKATPAAGATMEPTKAPAK